MSARVGNGRTDDRGTERAGDVAALVEGILREAREEARRNLDEARMKAEARVAAAETQAARIREESVAAADRQVSAIDREAGAKLASELARAELASREAAWKATVARALELCRDHAREPAFGDTLARLAAEAAIGLGGGELRVRAGGLGVGRIDASVLREAERLAREKGGIETRLSAGEPFADGNPGVVLESIDGRTSFDNRLEARFARLEGQLRARVLRGLFGADEDASGGAGNGRGTS